MNHVLVRRSRSLARKHGAQDSPHIRVIRVPEFVTLVQVIACMPNHNETS
ncbi:hypothetical protein [Burkholderia diffusa]|nr:hypothetical protein [Burkholderia diffusa]